MRGTPTSELRSVRVPAGFNIPAASSRGLAKCRDVLRAYVVTDGGPGPDRRDSTSTNPADARSDLTSSLVRSSKRSEYGARIPAGLTVCDRVVFGDRHVTDAVSTGAQHAGEVFEDRWPLLLQADTPQDYVLATGHAMTAREFSQAAFARVGLDWERHVAYDPRYERPSEVDALIGDASKAQRDLGWTAQTYGPALVHVMVDADVQALEDELAGRGVQIDR